MLTSHFLAIGMAMVGWVIPEFGVAIGQGKVKFPVFINIIMAAGMAFIGVFIEAHIK